MIHLKWRTVWPEAVPLDPALNGLLDIFGLLKVLLNQCLIPLMDSSMDFDDSPLANNFRLNISLVTCHKLQNGNRHDPNNRYPNRHPAANVERTQRDSVSRLSIRESLMICLIEIAPEL